MWELERKQFRETSRSQKKKRGRETKGGDGLGSFSRAVDRIKSFGVADMSDPDVQRQMIAKHPPRYKEMQASVIKESPVSAKICAT